MAEPMQRFYLDTAARLGRTKREFLESVTSTEITEYLAWYRIEHEIPDPPDDDPDAGDPVTQKILAAFGGR